MNYTISTEMPEGFVAHTQGAGCYIAHGEKLLMIRRHENCSQGNTWGVPAGKLEPNETPVQAVIREMREEIGFDVSANVIAFGKLYIVLPHVSYIFHLFYTPVNEIPELVLKSDECVEARWLTIDEARKLPLIRGADVALDCYQTFLATR